MELFCVLQKLEALEKWLAATEIVNSKLDHISDQLAVQMDTVVGAAERTDNTTSCHVGRHCCSLQPAVAAVCTGDDQ